MSTTCVFVKSSFRLTGFVVSLFYFIQPPPASAQLSKLDETGKHITEKFKALKPHPIIVNVADFSSTDNALLPQAHYLAWYISGTLESYGKDFLRVPDHPEFDRNLVTIMNTTTSTLPPEDLPRFSGQIGGDFIVVGTIARSGSEFLLNLRVFRVSDRTLIASETVNVRSSEFLESLSVPLRPQNGQALLRPGQNGIGMPACTHAPDPSYTKLARASKVNGRIVMEAIISTGGTIAQIHPLKLLGYGLDEQAFNTIKSWKCKPAEDRQGNPVTVAVPIEVTFRLN